MNTANLQKLLDQIDGKKTKVITKKDVYVREWGEDSQISQHHLCTVIDKTTMTMYLIGGVGVAENLVTELSDEGHTIHQFEGHTKKAPKTPIKIVSTGRRHLAGLMLDKSPKWERMVVIRGNADFHVMLHNHHGRRKRI